MPNVESPGRAPQMSLLFDLWLINHLISGALDEALTSTGGLSGEDFGFYSLLRRFGPVVASQVSRWTGLQVQRWTGPRELPWAG